MTIHIIRPEDIRPPYSKIIDKGYKVVFLAGPIKGALNWQHEAIELLSNLWTEDKAISDLVIADPRCKNWHGDFNHQVDWETYNLIRADAILFWLAKEAEHDCGRSYAQTTRFELGEHAHKQKTIIGLEPGFTGESYLRRRLGDDRIYSAIYSTCEAVITYINCQLR